MSITRKQKPINDADLLALLASYEAGTTVDENGTIQFHDLDSDELECILPDAYEPNADFTARQLRYLLRKALLTCRKKGQITIRNLTAEAQRIANTELAQPHHRFSLWTKFRARQMPHANSFRIKWDGVTIESADRLPAYMRKDEYFLNGHGQINPNEPEFYGYLIARCKARSEENAVVQMLDATELFMAVFNMYELRRWWSRGTERWAEGKLWNGPYQFVFRGKKFLGEERIWYDPNFSEQGWRTFSLDMPDVLTLLPQVRRALKALANHPLRDVLIKVFRLMQNAMSSRDQSYSLLRLWTALEQLYGDPQSNQKSYSGIIDRASFAERDKSLAKWKLFHISRSRNEYVHTGDTGDDLRVMAQYLRELLSRHMNYLLFHAPYVRSHTQWLEIVDYEDDMARLNERKANIDQRIAIIRQGRKGESDG